MRLPFTVPAFLRSYYFLSAVALPGWLLFFDGNDLITQTQGRRKLATQAYPSPFTTDRTLAIRTGEFGPATVTVTDAVGRIVLRQELLLTAGSSTVAVPGAGKLAVGMYVLPGAAGHPGS